MNITQKQWNEINEKVRDSQSHIARLQNQVDTLKSKTLNLESEASNARRTTVRLNALVYDIEQAFNFLADRLGVARFLLYVRRDK
jgi:FtsZ-binding cell division protein ZapB